MLQYTNQILSKPLTFKQRRIALLLAIGVIILIYLFFSYNGSLKDKYLSWWSDLFWTVGALAAGLRSLKTASTRKLKYERIAWTCFSVAAISWFVGMLVWDYYEVFGNTMVPFPSIGDWFFVGYALSFIVGFAFYRFEMPSRDFTLIQISNLGLIVSTSIVLCFIVLAEPLKQSSNPIGYEAYALTHVFTTVGCFIFSVYCFWFYTWKENRFSLQLLLISLLIMALADTLYAFQLLGRAFNASSYLNVYWVLCFALQYWAAFEQDAVTNLPPQPFNARGMYGSSNIEAIMPAFCLFIALIFSYLFRDQLNSTTMLAIIFGAIAFSIFLTVREWYSNRLENKLMEEIRSANQRLEERVRQRTEDLLVANSELEAFCYSVSHDLRAPLRGIKGFSQILLEDFGDVVDETGHDYLNRVCNGAQNMSNIIDALLDLSKVSRHNLQKKEVKLDDVANEIIAELTELYPDRNVNVYIEKGMTAFGDSHLIRIALENLLNNAWKYTGKTENAQIEFGSYKENSEIVFYIKDNGVGFDSSRSEKIFDAFQRLHSQEFEGTGIGLATVARCIRRHGGKIWADSDVGKGASFYFTLATAESIRERSGRQFLTGALDT